jgi:D-inositol-3-phosphate glycosyltransferase
MTAVPPSESSSGDARRERARRYRPRVALVSWHTSPLAAPGSGRAGGMNVYVREVARALSRSGLRVDVLTQSRSPFVAPLGDGARLVAVAAPECLAECDLALPRYDVVHSHYWQSAAAAAVLVERSGARHVHTFHTLAEVKNLTRVPDDVVEPEPRLHAERELAAAADAVVVATDAEREQVVELLAASPRRVYVATPGVDHDLFRPGDGGRARARLGLAGRLVVVHVGRIQPLKGIPLAARALAETAPELPRACTLLVAGGPSGVHGARAVRELQEWAARLRSHVEVRLLGRWSHAALPSLLAAADAAVVCSSAESFCLAALEAQSCGVPLVGTAVGGVPDFVRGGESGFVVARTTAAIAARLGELLSSPRRRVLRASAVASARRFSWAATAEAIRAAYAL